jgi:hypothetical protein
LRKVLLVTFAFAAVPAGVAVAESDGLKVTGGGQVLVGASNENAGPGDTIAFTAQQTGDQGTMDAAPAKGQLQVINRTAGTGLNQTKFHGEVTCIRTVTFDQGTPDPSDDQTYIRFGGFEKVRGTTTTTPFTVDTQDNGEGAGSDDYILFRERPQDADPCDDEELETELRSTTLARGNVKAH